jgi:hypothetical protein
MRVNLHFGGISRAKIAHSNQIRPTSIMLELNDEAGHADWTENRDMRPVIRNYVNHRNFGLHGVKAWMNRVFGWDFPVEKQVNWLFLSIDPADRHGAPVYLEKDELDEPLGDDPVKPTKPEWCLSWNGLTPEQSRRAMCLLERAMPLFKEAEGAKLAEEILRRLKQQLSQGPMGRKSRSQAA